MLEDPDEDVRVAAAEALGRLGDPIAVSALIEHLDDPCRTVRRYAIISLGRLADPRAVGQAEGETRALTAPVRCLAWLMT